MADYQLAQINIAAAKEEINSPVMEGFASRIDEINTLAEQSPGFVWRLKSEYGDATAIRVFDDPLLLINMSVWKDIAALQHYVYKSMHVELIKDKAAWFNKMKVAHQALWWIPKGHTPTLEEAKNKLDYIRQHGPSQEAFTFAKSFPPPL